MLNATNLGKNMQEDFQKLYKSKKRRASWLAFFDFLPPNGRMNSAQIYAFVKYNANFEPFFYDNRILCQSNPN